MSLDPKWRHAHCCSSCCLMLLGISSDLIIHHCCSSCAAEDLHAVLHVRESVCVRGRDVDAGDGAEHHVLAEVVLCAVGRVAPLPADGDDGAKHCLARAGDDLQDGLSHQSPILKSLNLPSVIK